MFVRRYGSGGIGFRPDLSPGPAIKWLLIANAVVYLSRFFFRGGSSALSLNFLIENFAFVPSLAFGRFEIWRFVSYMFLHADFWHVALNMFGLWMFGTQLERVWGTRSFLVYYFVGGIGGALTYGVFSLTGADAVSYMLGASGAVYAILLAYGLTFPNAIILLFFFFPMKAKYAVAIFALIEFLSIPGGGNVAHLAHLGGMIFGSGFLYFFGGIDRQQLGSLTALRRTWRRWRARANFRVVEPTKRENPFQRRRRDGGNGSRRVNGDRIDEILDKISREGLDSLTDEEKEILRRASRKR